MKAHPKFRPDMDTYNTSYNDINVGDIWYANFPFDDDEYVDENKISDAGKDRVCIVIEKRDKNDPYPFTVVKCTTKVDKVPKEYRVEVPLMSECVDCRKLAMLKPYHFRRKHFYMLNNSKFNEVRRKIKLASDNDELSNVILEDSALMLLCDDSIEDQVLYEIAIFLGRINIIDESKLKSSERTDFGIPSKKAYPMPDEAHVRAAIRMFNHCSPEDEAELARNIKKYMKKYNMEDVEVSEKNRFSKYYKKPVKESYIEESAKKKYHTYEDAKIVFNSLTEREKKWCCPNGYKNTPAMVFRKVAYDNDDNPLGFVELGDAYKYKPEDFYRGKVGLTIAVHKSGRGKGIAKALIKLAVYWFKESEYEVLFYNVDSDNKASIKLAEKCGFIWYCDIDNKHAIRYVITNGTKMKKAIRESNDIIQEAMSKSDRNDIEHIVNTFDKKELELYGSSTDKLHKKEDAATVWCKVYHDGKIPTAYASCTDSGKLGLAKGDVNLAFAVNKNYRGQGLAKKLIKEAVHWFKGTDYDTLTYIYRDGNKASESLAKQSGFVFMKKLNKNENWYMITNPSKIKAIGEESNDIYFEEEPETDIASIAEEVESMIQELSGGGGPMIGMEINDQSVTTYNPGMFIISYGSKKDADPNDDIATSSGYAVANDLRSKYILVKRKNKVVREDYVEFLTDRKISIYEYTGDVSKWYEMLKSIDEGKSDGEFYTALTGRELLTDDQIYFDEHFKYYNPFKTKIENGMTLDLNKEYSLVEGREFLLPVMDDEMLKLQERVNNINPNYTIKEGPKGYFIVSEAEGKCSALPLSKHDIEEYVR